MEQFKFSPGPWSIDVNKTAIVRLSDCLRIEQTFEADNFIRFMSENEMITIGDANAKLIACSPEMVNELKENHQFLITIYSSSTIEKNAPEWLLQDMRTRMAKQLQLIEKATK